MSTSTHQFLACDTDSEDAERAATAFVSGINLHLESGQVFPATGNILVPYALPAGTNQTLGALPDGATGTLVELLYNSNGAHRLIRYDPTGNAGTGTRATLLEWAGLNLSPDLPIGAGKNGGIIDGLLTYRDASGELRCLSLARATAGEYTSARLLADPFVLHLTKSPPVQVITGNRSGGTGAAQEALRLIQSHAFQFSYQWRREDGELSVQAPYSQWFDVTSDPGTTADRVILLTIPVPPVGVTEILLTVRSPDTNIWQVADTLRPVNGVFPVGYSFYGQILGGALPDADATRLFESLWPCKAGPTLARNRLHAADFLEGYPTPQPLFTATAESAGNPADRTFHENSSYRVSVQFYDALGRPAGCAQPVTVPIPRRAAGSGTEYGIRAMLSTTGVAALNAEIPAWAYSYQFLVARNDRTLYFLQGRTADVLGYLGLEKKVAEDGTVTEFPQVVDVQHVAHDEVLVDISSFAAVGQGYVFQPGSGDICRFLNEQKDFPILGQIGSYLRLHWSGYPDMSIDSAGNTLAPVEIYTPNTNPQALYYERGPRLRILRDSSGNRSYEQASVLLEGDCFLISLKFPVPDRTDTDPGNASTTGTYVPPNRVSYMPGGDYQVESMVPRYRLAPSSTTTRTIYDKREKGGFFSTILSNPLNIISPVLLFNEAKYLFGADPTTPTNTSLTTVDTATRSAADLIWLDASWGGRPGAVIPPALQQVRRRALERFSGQKQSDNLVNGLSRWEPLNQYDKLPQEQGAVTALVLADPSQTGGSVLVALQRLGDTSLYLNQQPTKIGDAQQLLITNDVVGGDNTLRGHYGCVDPASIAATGDGTFFFWCREKQEAVRYNKGMVPLGEDYKYRRRLQTAARLYGSSPVRGCFDPRRQEYLLTFDAVAGDIARPGLTLVWSERRSAWADALAWLPEAGQGVGNELATWRAGILYRHTTTAPVGTFGGVYTAPQVAFAAANPGGNLAKTFQNIAVRSQAQWTPTLLTTPSGQKSRILPAWMRFIKGVWRAAIRRDENSPGFGGDVVQALHKGREMQDTALYVTLTCPVLAPAPLAEASIDFLTNTGQFPNA
ncbi:MAG: hypothetical protein ACRYFX_18895 [Janthinobacterium lividum]